MVKGRRAEGVPDLVDQEKEARCMLALEFDAGRGLQPDPESTNDHGGKDNERDAHLEEEGMSA